ncbi:MAG: rhodanese-like domain-containing protein [Flavobacteriales bacterium]|nr:rhodanese-like domain-containing protein [Flavobacteriales bacterium]MCB0757503.1 rhodanese-like domain-containing protein [Flavobacteriales bacterium]
MSPLIKAAHRTALVLLLLIATGAAQAQHVQEPAYQEKLQHLLSDKTPVIDVPQLAKEPKVVLLDARSKEEYDVSHIAKARRVGYDDFDIAKVKDLPKDAAIVVYCSVGYRSERVTEKLLKAGYTSVRNLYGGIFEWVNTGHAVVDDVGKPTNRIHTYNKNWSRWALKGEKVH